MAEPQLISYEQEKAQRQLTPAQQRIEAEQAEYARRIALTQQGHRGDIVAGR